ncbi:MAG: DUF3794 and LysM peptidoglycan-binding domain-containing protein [Oscillospiraceae bacterium]
MDCKTVKENINISEMFIENKLEQPIESEFSLAEYYGEIMQILKCIPSIRVMSKQVVSNKVIIDGYVDFKILYLSPDNKGINCFEHNTAFNKTIDIKEEYDNHIVDVDLNIPYLNCRAVNRRRIELRGALSFLVKTTYIKNVDIPVKVEENTIQQYSKKISYTPTLFLKEKNFTMNENLSIPCEDSKEIVILRTDENFIITDYKCIANKVIIKGECLVNVLYLENKYDSEIKAYKQLVQINQIIDVNGIDETCKCICLPKILSCVFDKNTEDDENGLMLNIYGSIMIKGYKEITVYYIEDIYSTKYDVNCTHQDIIMDHIKYNKDIKISEDLVLDNFVCNNAKILDLNVVFSKRQSKIVDDCISFVFDVEVNCLYEDEDENIMFNTKVKEISYKEDYIENISLDNSDVFLRKWDIKNNISGENLELKLELIIDMMILSKNNAKIIDKINMNDEKEKEQLQNATLTIYYGDKEEKIWDIAKKYNTCVDEILKQNNIESEELKERTMLLIPIVR